MIQRRSRSSLKPIRLIRRRNYPSQPDKSTGNIPSSNTTNDKSLRPMRGYEVNDRNADQWAVIWPG